MARQLTAERAVELIRDGDMILASGFYGNGTAPDLIDAMVRQGKKDLTVVCNDGGGETKGVGRLIYNRQVKKFICSWCGRTPLVPELEAAGEMELELCPQGSLAERIRAGGFGLGGILTPTGLDTVVEERWGQRVLLNGRHWLYQTPIHAQVAVLEAWRADEAGNLIFRHTQRNFSTVMAYAADLVIVSVVNPIEKAGDFHPDEIMVPGVCVDILVQQEGA